MTENLNMGSSPYCVTATSGNDSDTMSTSPILDTTKVSRKRKLWTPRRAITDSAYLPSSANITKCQKNQPPDSRSSSSKNLETSAGSNKFNRCLSCDSTPNTNQKFLNCSDEKAAGRSSDCLNESLGDRLKKLKLLKKPAVRIADAQIAETDFYESDRILDKACFLTPPTQIARSPTKCSGFVTFTELSQMQEQKNALPASHSFANRSVHQPGVVLEPLRLSQIATPRKSPNVSHLTLDEDNEEERDIFEDTIDNPEAVQDLEEFTPWKYNSVDTSASPFHGFSSLECSSSQDIAEKHPQFRKLYELDALEPTAALCARESKINVGLATAGGCKRKMSEASWSKSKAAFNAIKDTCIADPAQKEKDLEEFTPRKHKSIDTSASLFHGFSSLECSSSQDIAGKNSQFRKLNELNALEPTAALCARETKINPATAAGCEIKISEASWSKPKAVFHAIKKPCIADLAEKEKEREPLAKSESKIHVGFATAGGREIKISEASWSKSKAVFDAIEEPCIAEPAQKEKEREPLTKSGSKINFGFASAGGREIKISEASWSKPKAVFHAITKPCIADLAQKEKEREPLAKNESKINFGFATAGGREIKISEASWSKSKAVFDAIEEPYIADPAQKEKEREPLTKSGSKINFGFASAGGREIKISEASWSKSEAAFDAIEEPCIADPAQKEKEREPLTKSESKINLGFATAGGREIKISEASWSKSKAAFDAIEEPCIADPAQKEKEREPLTKSESKINLGFATAGGREIKISEASWSKSKAVFDAIEEPCIADPAQKEKEHEPLTKRESKINFGFATAGGREIKISEASWSKSKAVFDAIEDPCIADPAQKEKEREPLTKSESKMNVGFASAGGREIKISKTSWTKSKAVFDAIEEPCIADVAQKIKDAPEGTVIIAAKNKTKTTTSGFSTVSAKNDTTEAVSAEEAQSSSYWDNVESLDLEDFEDPVEETEVTKKRKVEEIDEETPLRRDSSLKRKKGRYANDLQARKLFIEDSNNENDEETTKVTSKFLGLDRVSLEKNLISEEVDAISSAFYEDEERPNDGTTSKICALIKDGSVSPELGCETNIRSRADVSTRNLPGNRVKLQKVNDAAANRDSNFPRAASGSSAAKEENNHRAAPAEKREESQEIQHESIPDDLTFDSQFSQDIEPSPMTDKFIADTTKIMEDRLAMALKQDKAIRDKRRIKPAPRDGSLYQLKNCNRDARISWQQLTEGTAPSSRVISGDSSGCDFLSITANSAADYRFRCADFYGEGNVRSNVEGLKVGDGAFLIMDEKNCAGARELERAFLASPGVDPNLVPTGWVRNHYRWIVWKLASMDRVKFGDKILPRMLTPNNVMYQLKYRYDREIYRTQWPPLRKILERSEDASARLVLCVSSIVTEKNEDAPVKSAYTPNSVGSTVYKMTLTDGWYSIAASIDTAMIYLIKSGKVREGTKLMTFGAKVVNLDQGCSVLEIPEAVTLRIYSNSTRRTKWDTKLDFYRANRGPMPLSLKSVNPKGGAICKLVVAVSRLYPMMYREKLPDGQSVLRNERCEEEAALAHEARCQATLDEISAWSESEISSMSGMAKKSFATEEESAACSKDMEEEWKEKISSKMSECLPTPRDVTPVLKIRVAEEDTCALVTIWSIDSETTEPIVEGSSITICNSFASGLRSSELQITAGRSTYIKREVSRRISYPERIYTSLSSITEPSFNPVYGEFDTIGIVTSTGPAPHGMKNFDTVNLACPKPGDADESDFLSVLFWQGVSAYGYAKILTTGSLVACSNLEWRRNARSIPTAYCTERSVFSKNPRQNHLTQAFESLRNEIKEPLAYAAVCATIIEEEIARKSAPRTPGSATGTPYRPATSSSRTPGWSPRNLTNSIDADCTTPRIDSKNSSTRKRLQRLEAYGEAPALPSIVINNSSRKVLLSPFRPPVTRP